MDKNAMEYLTSLPAVVPEGKVLVHNQVYPVARRPGLRGSRIWLMPPDPAHLDVCDCGWAPELGPHYRVHLTPGATRYEALQRKPPSQQPKPRRR